MKEYKAERLVGVAQSSKLSIENSLNIAAIGDWELVCVSDGWAYYARERKQQTGVSDAAIRQGSTDAAQERTAKEIQQ